MIFMDLKVENFFAFKDFRVNFSYPKKIVGNTLGEECLSYCPGFRYKRVNIVMGANATGKTTLGRMFNAILGFISYKNFEPLIGMIGNPECPAEFIVEFIGDTQKIYRMNCKFLGKENEKYTSDDVNVSVVSTEIHTDDSYEKCHLRLVELEKKSKHEDYVHELEKIEDLSWLFEYPLDYNNRFFPPHDEHTFLKVANNVTKALDPAIEAIEKLNEVKDGYVIRTGNHDIVLKGGEVFKSNLLSSGTKAGIGVSCVLTAIISSTYGFYFCDEKFSYIDSEIEKAVLAVMIGQLRPDNQLFFTTHNVEILDMSLPKHAYMFMKKKTEDNYEISCVAASDLLKRNTDSLRKAVENDLFSSLPSVELIYDLEQMEG